MHWPAWDYFCLSHLFLWLTFQVEWLRISWDRLGYAMATNNYRISVTSNIKISFLHVASLLWLNRRTWHILDTQETCLMEQPPPQALLVARWGSSGRSHITIENALVWSISFTIHWPELVTWPHPTTKGSGSTSDVFPGGERIRLIWQAAPTTTTLNQHHFFSFLYFIN